jgi:hypothetical protein
MEHTNSLRRRVPLALATAALAMALPSCGGGGGGGGTVMGPSTQPVRQRQVLNGTWRVDPLATSGQAFYVLIDLTTAGDFDATVEWTLATNDIDIGLGSGDCRGRADTCTYLVESTSTTAKPERLSRAGLTAGQYTLVIINFGNEPDQGTYEIGLTR